MRETFAYRRGNGYLFCTPLEAVYLEESPAPQQLTVVGMIEDCKVYADTTNCSDDSVLDIVEKLRDVIAAFEKAHE